MDYSTTAKQLLEKLGGEKNIVSVTHCMTRLRFVLKDEGGINDGQVKAISGSMSPVIPAIIGAGMVQVLNIILGGLLTADSPTLQLMSVIGNTAFYFLPVLVAFSAGRKFGGNPFLVTAVVAILIHPNFVALTGAEGGINFLGIPVTSFDYSSSIIPAILTAWVMSYIERLVEKITPAFMKNFLKPMLIILVSTPIAFLLLGPLGSFIGGGLAGALVFIQSHFSIDLSREAADGAR